MNIYVEKGYATEMECGSNFVYILNDNASFLSTEYKVLQSQTDSCFVKCMKMLYNGKVQLYYLTKELQSLESMLPMIEVDDFLTIVTNLFANIIDVKHNGFLSCQNIDLSLNRIFVNPITYKVSIVYMPVSRISYDINSNIENEIRNRLAQLILSVSSLMLPKTMQLASDLTNKAMTLEEIYDRMKGNTLGNVQKGSDSGALHMFAINAPTKIEFVINKNDFVIGKSEALCDGVVGFNESISRSHCKIIRKGSQFFVADLQSKNGTYLNQARLLPYQPRLIKHGDVIRLVNIDFQVSVM